MEADFWHEKWEADSIGFHQARPNKHLQQWWPEAEIAQNSEVFVPLCGKSLDMLWLHEQGYKVTGIELSLNCLLYTSPSPRDKRQSRMPSSA